MIDQEVTVKMGKVATVGTGMTVMIAEREVTDMTDMMFAF